MSGSSCIVNPVNVSAEETAVVAEAAGILHLIHDRSYPVRPTNALSRGMYRVPGDRADVTLVQCINIRHFLG